MLRATAGDDPIGKGEHALLAVRPERIWLAHAGRNGSGPDHPGNRFGGRLVRSVFMGDTVEHVVDAEVGTLIVSTPNVEGPGGGAPTMGEEVVVGWTDDAARIIRERQPGA
ncbi:MAG: TOBE domain-containing protein [Chloroflexota bacterium]